MLIEWDPAKNDANRVKHGIDFRDAIAIFDGPTVEQVDHRRDYGETRIIAMGTMRGREIVVVYVHRRDALRIISARKANSHERENYRRSVRGEGK